MLNSINNVAAYNFNNFNKSEVNSKSSPVSKESSLNFGISFKKKIAAKATRLMRDISGETKVVRQHRERFRMEEQEFAADMKKRTDVYKERLQKEGLSAKWPKKGEV